MKLVYKILRSYVVDLMWTWLVRETVFLPTPTPINIYKLTYASNKKLPSIKGMLI